MPSLEHRVSELCGTPEWRSQHFFFFFFFFFFVDLSFVHNNPPLQTLRLYDGVERRHLNKFKHSAPLLDTCFLSETVAVGAGIDGAVVTLRGFFFLVV
jgi:hypothetical protein